MSFLPHLSWECVVSELRFGWRSLGYAPTWHSCWSGCILERPPNHSIQARVTSSTQLCGRASDGTNTSVLKAEEACWCRKTLREVCLMEAKLFILYIYIVVLWQFHTSTLKCDPLIPIFPLHFSHHIQIPPCASLLFSVISLWIQWVPPVGARLWT